MCDRVIYWFLPLLKASNLPQIFFSMINAKLSGQKAICDTAASFSYIVCNKILSSLKLKFHSSVSRATSDKKWSLLVIRSRSIRLN